MKDFFVSYNRNDKQWAEWIAWTLEEAGYSVVIQAWDFRPGSNFVLDMHRATAETQKTIAVLSNTYLASAFTRPEWAAAFADDPESIKRKLLPVKVKECKPTGLLSQVVYVDLTQVSEAEANQLLLDSLKDRVKPEIKPNFPGDLETVEEPTPSATPFPREATKSRPSAMERIRQKKIGQLETRLSALEGNWDAASKVSRGDKRKIQLLKWQIGQLEKRLSALQENAEGILDQLNCTSNAATRLDLDRQLKNINEQIESTGQEIDEKQEKLDALKASSSSSGTLVEEANLVPPPCPFPNIQDVQTAQLLASSRIYVWSQSDRAPKTVIKGKSLTGERPQVYHLREGYFAPRPHIYGSLLNSAIDWLIQSPSEEEVEARLSVFWIEGRSGSGKSVALLHLLAGLHEKGYEKIFWLGNEVGFLPKALGIARELVTEKKPIVIGIDDPYAPNEEDSASDLWLPALRELADLREDGRTDALPIIFCCGPTEQKEQFEKDLSGKVAVNSYLLPRETPEDLQELREWYRKRTQNEPPELESEDIILVQLFFEWKTGKPLTQFAKNFRSRVKQLDRQLQKLGFKGKTTIEQVLAQILAINRLYVDYSHAAITHCLTEEQYDKLEEVFIEEDGHLTINPGERSGVRLTHPHLSNAIYRSWFSEHDQITTQTKHLKQAIRDSYTYEKENIRMRTAPLWGLSRALILGTEQHKRLYPKSKRRSRFDRQLKEHLCSMYTYWIEDNGGRLPLSLLPVWIQIYGSFLELNQQEQGLEKFRLKPDPIEVAIAQVHIDYQEESGLNLVCLKLLQFFHVWPKSKQSTIEDVILSFLETTSKWPWWREVTSYAIDRINSDRAQSLGRKWLRCSFSHPSWSHRWRKLLDANPSDKWLQAIGRDWLEYMSPASGWYYTWKYFLLEVFPNDEELIELGWQWLTKNPDTSGSWWYAVRELLVRIACSDITALQLALKWLKQETHNSHWYFVWEKLIKGETVLDDNEQTLLRLGKTLILQNEDHKSWQFIWEDIIKLSPKQEHDALLSIGRTWLERADEEHHSWGYVWGKLFDEFSNSHKWLQEQGKKWLKQNPNHHSWFVVWKKLLESQPQNKEISGIGKQWVQEVSFENDFWAYVWQALLEVLPGDEILLRKGRDWIEKSKDQRTWSYVWIKLLEVSPEKNELLHVGKKWLQDFPDHESWQYVWENLLVSVPEYEVKTLLEEGKVWIERASEHHSWAYVWERLMVDCPNDRELLRTHGENWLQKVPNHQHWSRVWTVLLEEHPNEEHPGKDKLLQIGEDWLQKASRHQYWYYVWDRLLQDYPDKSEVLEIGKDWLTQSPGHRYWSMVWNRLLTRFSKNKDLLEIGRSWLQQNLEHHSWGYVWKDLHNLNSKNSELLEIGKDWLGLVPMTTEAWGLVWSELYKVDPSNPNLIRRGKKWIKSVDAETRSVWKVWKPISSIKPLSPTMIATMTHWLEIASMERNSWPKIWLDLCQMPTDNSLRITLRKLGMTFLNEKITAPKNIRNSIFQSLQKLEGGS